MKYVCKPKSKKPCVYMSGDMSKVAFFHDKISHQDT